MLIISFSSIAQMNYTICNWFSTTILNWVLLERHRQQYFTTFPYKRRIRTYSFILNHKSEYHQQYRIALIKKSNISCQINILLQNSLPLWLKNIKQAFLNNSFPRPIVDEQIKRAI